MEVALVIPVAARHKLAVFVETEFQISRRNRLVLCESTDAALFAGCCRAW